MTELLAGWIRALTGAGVFCSLAYALCPRTKARGVLSIVCGCVMLLALLSPVKELDVTDIARAAAGYRAAAESVAVDGGETARELERRGIEARCEAYISDRADALGLAASSDVEARWSEEGYFFPWACALDIQYNSQLASAIEAELGIPQERQSWEAEK